MAMSLWFHRGKHFWIGPWTCEECKTPIEDISAKHVTNWSKNNSYAKLCCRKCAETLTKHITYAQEIRTVLCATDPPYGSTPIARVFPGLSNTSNISVFETATKNISGEITIDKTQYSGRQGYLIEGDEHIGKNPELVDYEREELGFDDPLKVLEFHATTQPSHLTHEEKRLLEKPL